MIMMNILKDGARNQSETASTPKVQLPITMSLGNHFIDDVEDRTKVLLLSGGGSGHEPAHAGYVGEGMLDICVAGQIFASPSASQILTGLKALDSSHGILMIVKNYTGDKLNFGLAAQKTKAEGIHVNIVFIGDDVSVKNNGLVGRRGLAGVAFVHKIAGALASMGATLEEVTDMAQRVADSISTVGVSLDRCSVPRRGQQQGLPFENLEYGMGIHNEPGVQRDTIRSLSTTAANLLSLLTPSAFNTSLPVAVVINNLGGLSVLEHNVIAGEVMDQLERTGLDIRRMLVGTFVASLDRPGFSVTILKLHSGFEALLNSKPTALAWTNLEESNHGTVNGVLKRTTEELKSSPVVTRDEPQITKYDTIAGDGDCGETLLKGVNAIHKHFSQISSRNIDLITTFHSVSITIENSIGDTSGALYTEAPTYTILT
ncbi:DAK1/DegV-like protein, partial [Acephala macrosclerotiorum]